MVDIDNLSDAELRTKLTEYGFPVMPITGTTRKVMAKKLKMLMESQCKGVSDRRSLGKLSSDEESDGDFKLAKKDKSRRITMAVPPMQQQKIKLQQEESSNDMDPPAPVQKEKRKSTGRSAKIIVQVQEDPDTNSDSEPEIVETDYKIEVPLKSKTPSVKKDSPPPVQSPSSVVTSRAPTATSRYSVYTKSTSDASEQLDKIRARLSLGPGPHYVPKYTPPLVEQAQDENEDLTPFLSNFTRRLQMSQKSELNSPTGRSDALNDYDANGSSYNRSSYLARPRGREYTRNTYGASNEDQPNKSSNVSFILIAATALFFVVLFALYYGMHSGSTSSDVIGKTTKYQPQDSL